MPRLVVVMDAEIQKGDQSSRQLLRQAIMILSAVSKRVALSTLLQNLRVLFSQATNKLMADAQLADIHPTVVSLQRASELAR